MTATGSAAILPVRASCCWREIATTTERWSCGSSCSLPSPAQPWSLEEVRLQTLFVLICFSRVLLVLGSEGEIYFVFVYYWKVFPESSKGTLCLSAIASAVMKRVDREEGRCVLLVNTLPRTRRVFILLAPDRNVTFILEITMYVACIFYWGGGGTVEEIS